MVRAWIDLSMFYPPSLLRFFVIVEFPFTKVLEIKSHIENMKET